jgi:hypothetical protein
MDQNYLAKLESRMEQLEQREIKTRQDISHAKQELDLTKEALTIELASLKGELSQLDAQVAQSIERVKLVLTNFKHVSKKGDLQRLQARVDAWAPEQKVSRKQFIDLLQEL